MYKGWNIEGVGGFCTVRHYWASKGDEAFWAFRQRDAKALIDQLEAGTLAYASIASMYKRALY